ncbi:hypothetical protein EK21DRAFT_88602 [Setomelanomma holmii]|uniref:Uncharacterized protein n=1 Tax=Setomelanomma holmii TaxID=210430 RepID=A0A9P4LNP0_9PLEO|nr:hypothetical protein EK21DRAFT_88602 [Setomelanomma holmii]
MSNAVVTPINFLRYILALQKSPKRVRRVDDHLDLYGAHPPDVPFGLYPMKESEVYDEAFYQSCLETLTEVCDSPNPTDWGRDLSRYIQCCIGECLAFLLLVLPDLKSLALSDQFIRESPRLWRLLRRSRQIPLEPFEEDPKDFRRLCTWLSTVFTNSASKIQRMDIVNTGIFKDTLGLKLKAFPSLTHLTVSAPDIIFKPIRSSQNPTYDLSRPENVLPASAQSIHLQVGTFAHERQYLLQWLDAIANDKEVLPNLNRVLLDFNATLAEAQRDFAAYRFGHHRGFAIGLNIAENQNALSADFASLGVTTEMEFRRTTK